MTSLHREIKVTKDVEYRSARLRKHHSRLEACFLGHQKSFNPSNFKLALESPQVIVQDPSFPLYIRLLHEEGPSTTFAANDPA